MSIKILTFQIYYGVCVGAGGKAPKPGKRSKNSETLVFNITSKNLSVYQSCITKCIVLQLMGNSSEGMWELLVSQLFPKELKYECSWKTCAGRVCQAANSNLLQ